MYGDEGFEDYHPCLGLGPLYQQVSQLGDRHVGLVGALEQICGWDRGRRLSCVQTSGKYY